MTNANLNTGLEAIIAIEKSWKYEGYCFITNLNSGKEAKRRFYEIKTGTHGGLTYAYYENLAYGFKWGGPKGTSAVGIICLGNYKSVDEIAGNEPAAKHVIPMVNPTPAAVVPTGEVRHEQYSKIKSCVSKFIPVYLVGPAGSGKNHVLEQIAWELGLDFHCTNSIQQEFKLTGFIDAGGKFHETEFYRAFVYGGLFFLDEMDASIPEVLVLLNMAIANRYFEFPTGKVSAHESFRVVAAGNTVGDGADEQYTGRMVMDQATMDRFATIRFDYSLPIEMLKAKGDTELVTFIRDLRDQAKAKGIRATFSYRCITMVTELKGEMELVDVLEIAVFKGMDKDTMKTFRPTSSSKYATALKKLQA